MNRKFYFLIIYLVTLYSQGIKAQNVISSQGNSFKNQNITLDFTIGETIIETHGSGNIELAQGFHQPIWSIVGLNDFSPEIDALLYPNPTADELVIEHSFIKLLGVKIYNSEGKLVLENNLNQNQTQIKVAHLAPGNYSLSIVDGCRTMKTFRLIRSH